MAIIPTNKFNDFISENEQAQIEARIEKIKDQRTRLYLTLKYQLDRIFFPGHLAKLT